VKPFRFYLIVLLIVVCDQVSKWAVTAQIPFGGSRPILGHWLLLTPTRNTGGAFSLFQARNSVFMLVAVVAIAALLYAYHRFQRRELLVSAALSLALGGAVGNLIDRLRFGYVVDFFDVRVWPIFNVADSAITIGILLLAWHFLFHKQAEGEGGRTHDSRLTTHDSTD
jgi:signal peptidase II